MEQGHRCPTLSQAEKIGQQARNPLLASYSRLYGPYSSWDGTVPSQLSVEHVRKLFRLHKPVI